MAPRILRPRSDRPMWPLVGAIGFACVAVGYVAAARVFDPGPQANANESGGGEAEPANGGEPAPTEVHDAGAAPVVHVAATPIPTPPEVPPRVPVRIAAGITQSCGDGEELNIPGARCAPVPGVDEPVRHHLERLGDCPGAEVAAEVPSHTLSIGLRVDFARHRVTALPGRSSSVRNAMTFVPCARAAFDHASELWQLTPPHPRYLYFFSVRFGPLGARTPVAEAPATPTPVAAPETPSVVVDAGHAIGATPAATPAPASSAPVPTPPVTPTPSPAAHGTPLSHPEHVPIVWERVVVRDAPRTGAIVGHLVRGAEVTLIGREAGWFEVRFSGGTGWIFGEAVGR